MAFIPKYDEYAANVSLLLPFDTALTDYSVSPNTVTAFGNAAVSAVQKKFGAKSCYFDGTGDYLVAPYSSGIDLIGGAFTIETWIYPTTVRTEDSRIISTGGGVVGWNSSNGIHILVQTIVTTNKLNIQISNGTTGNISCETVAAVPRGAWSHIACCVDASMCYLSINGVVESFAVGTVVRPTTNPILNIATIPGEAGAANTNFAGYLDEIRITKGVARYTTNFTPPDSFLQIEDTIPLTASSLQMFAPPSPWMDNVPSMAVTPSLFISTEARQQVIPIMINPAQMFLPKVTSPWQDFIPRYSTAPQVFDPTNYRPPILSASSSPVWTRTTNNPRFIKTEV